MPRTPRMDQIEAMLAEEPDDAFLRYGLAMEHAAVGDDAMCVGVLQELIARTPAKHAVSAVVPAKICQRNENFARVCDDARLEAFFGCTR